ncbi:hypothetical protein P5673_030102, partial [Acropora cervicornis]
IGNSQLVFTVNHRNIDQLTVKRSKGWWIEESYATIVPEQNIERLKTNCQKCNSKHHTSICDKNSSQLMLATGEGSVVYPVVVMEVEGIRCRALLDTGAGSSYASASLIERLNKQPDHKQYKRIEMMMTTMSQKEE